MMLTATYEVVEVARAEELLKEEMAACPQCGSGPGPAHARTTFLTHNGVRWMRQSDCGSNSRHWDHATQQWVGRSHCTCDLCW